MVDKGQNWVHFKSSQEKVHVFVTHYETIRQLCLEHDAIANKQDIVDLLHIVDFCWIDV